MKLKTYKVPVINQIVSFLRYNKRILSIALICAVLMTVIVCGYGTFCIDGLYKWVDGMVEDICSTGGYEKIVTEAKVNISPTSITIGGIDMSGSLSTAMTSMNNIMVSVAITVFCIMWLISLVRCYGR